MTCAVVRCPGRGDVGLPCGLSICQLHADAGVVVPYRDNEGSWHVRVDMGRIRFSLSSRRGRLMRQMLAAIR
ncbi:MAG TPA: hypothetical protein VMH41_16985 [Mycobacteriales bacterium]|nr:hypothetical protein [Mycobacteriales bacterium]